MPKVVTSARILAATAVLALRLGGVASADEGRARPSARRNTITTNPVRYAILHFQVEYERVVADRWSLFAAPIGFYHDTWYPFAQAPEMTARGFGLDLGGRYFFGPAPAGLFIGPYLSAYRGEVFRADVKTLDGYIFSAGVQGGYTLLLGRWVLSAGLGLSYGFPTEEPPEGSAKAEGLPHAGAWTSFRMNAGLAF